MSTPTALAFGQYYHIFNRGNNRETLFRQERNYAYFMDLYARHIIPIADTYAYCLLPNHFHLLVRVKREEEILEPRKVLSAAGHGKQASEESGAFSKESILKPIGFTTASQSFGNLFNAYTKAVNKLYARTGSLFEKPFHRKQVTDDEYFLRLVLYIHYNPQKHGLISDFRSWPFSSYASMLSDQPTRLKRDEVLTAFGDRKVFIKQHEQYQPGEFDEEF